jgi:hypothetical protein
MSFLHLRFRYSLITLVALAVIAIPLASVSQTPANTPVNLSDKTAALLPVGFANSGIEDFALADIDGNGYPDIIYISTPLGNPSGIKTLLNSGGTFAPAPGYSVDNIIGSPVAFAVGDINQDSHPDILLAVGDTFRLLLNDPIQKVFVENNAFPIIAALNALNITPRLIELADANHDSYLDVWISGAVNDATANILLAYNMNQSGYVAYQLPAELQDAVVTDIKFADLNYDNLPEAVIAAPENLSIYNVSSDSLVRNDAIPAEARPLFISASDIDSDGDIDIVGATLGKLEIIYNNGISGFTAGIKPIWNNAGEGGVNNSGGRILSADINLDAMPDLVLITDGRLQILQQVTTPTGEHGSDPTMPPVYVRTFIEPDKTVHTGDVIEVPVAIYWPVETEPWIQYFIQGAIAYAYDPAFLEPSVTPVVPGTWSPSVSGNSTSGNLVLTHWMFGSFTPPYLGNTLNRPGAIAYTVKFTAIAEGTVNIIPAMWGRDGFLSYKVHDMRLLPVQFFSLAQGDQYDRSDPSANNAEAVIQGSIQATTGKPFDIWVGGSTKTYVFPTSWSLTENTNQLYGEASWQSNNYHNKYTITQNTSGTYTYTFSFAAPGQTAVPASITVDIKTDLERIIAQLTSMINDNLDIPQDIKNNYLTPALDACNTMNTTTNNTVFLSNMSVAMENIALAAKALSALTTPINIWYKLNKLIDIRAERVPTGFAVRLGSEFLVGGSKATVLLLQDTTLTDAQWATVLGTLTATNTVLNHLISNRLTQSLTTLNENVLTPLAGLTGVNTNSIQSAYVTFLVSYFGNLEVQLNNSIDAVSVPNHPLVLATHTLNQQITSLTISNSDIVAKCAAFTWSHDILNFAFCRAVLKKQTNGLAIRASVEKEIYSDCDGSKIKLIAQDPLGGEVVDIDNWGVGCMCMPLVCPSASMIRISIIDEVFYNWSLEGTARGQIKDNTKRIAEYLVPEGMALNEIYTDILTLSITDGRGQQKDWWLADYEIKVTKQASDHKVEFAIKTKTEGEDDLITENNCICILDDSWNVPANITGNAAINIPEYVVVDSRLILSANGCNDTDTVYVQGSRSCIPWQSPCSWDKPNADIVTYKWEIDNTNVQNPGTGEFIPAGANIGKEVLFKPTAPGEIKFKITPLNYYKGIQHDETDRAENQSTTAVKIEMEKCQAAFEPKGGAEDNTTTIKVTVTPDAIKGDFKFTLYEVSNEPGYCMNAPQTVPSSGEDSASWKDLQFTDEGQINKDFRISGTNKDIAETKAPDSKATVTVKCYDYGAYGKIKAQFIKGSLTLCAKEQGGTKYHTNIPLDDNNNYIWDNSPLQNTGPGTNKKPEDDNDNTPAGNGTDGDGITRYEEWRGFMVNGTFTRLDTNKKDVFVRNVDVTDAGTSGFFTTGALTTPVYAISNSEWISSSRVVNFNYGTAHGDNQQAIKVENGGTDPLRPERQGVSLASAEPWVPNRQTYCKVYVATIKKGTLIDKVGGINATETTIPVTDTTGYRNNGVFKVGNEEIAYTGKTGTSFTGCTRGANGTIATAHSNGGKVFYYVNEIDFINRTFAHEAGHLVGLEEGSLSDENIMSEPGQRGITLGDGFWSTFIGVSSSLTGEFVVKE